MNPDVSIYYNIPEELRKLNQWCNWKLVDAGSDKPAKQPINSRTGKLASVSNSSTWSTFEEAIAAAPYCSGIGFIFTKECGYCGIDLDDPYEKLSDGTFKYANPEAIANRNQFIVVTFPGYWEISQSGKGLHGIVKAYVETGRRRESAEIYCTGRYFVMTGNVFSNDPIVNHSFNIQQLWLQMGKEQVQPTDMTGLIKPQTLEDAEIYRIASTASNGAKFIELWEGRWEQFNYAGNQSDADIALLNMLVFYTQNTEQIVRMFHTSALGKRPKAHRHDYLYKFCLPKAFDQTLPTLNIDTLRNNLEDQLASTRAVATTIEAQPATECGQVETPNPAPSVQAPSTGNLAPFCPYPSQGATENGLSRANLEAVFCPIVPVLVAPVQPVQAPISVPQTHIENVISETLNTSSSVTVPPGIIGEIARFIHDAAPRPVPEIAIVAALGLMAGVCGRAYNVSGTGLNQYIFLLAQTGRGKEAISSGISTLMNSVYKTVPNAKRFIGPAKIASSPALMKYITKNSKSFVSIMGEFADTLKKMSNGSKDTNKQDLRIDMLDLFNKSGHGNVLGSLIYSDKDKSTEVITAPAFSVIGESTNDKFYEHLSKEMILEGLLPRFNIIEYHGDRPPLNKAHKSVKPSNQLVDYFSSICAYCDQLNNGDQVLNVQFSIEAEIEFDKFDKLCDWKINTEIGAFRELWNRAHIKALKLAALLAVGVNYINPIIDIECTNWAITLVRKDIENILSKFETGEVGAINVQNEQIVEVKKALKSYVTKEWNQVQSYSGATLSTWNQRIIPHSYVSAICRTKTPFKTDRLGPIPALNMVIKSMLECGDIVELSPIDKRAKGLSGAAKMYMIVNFMGM